MSMMSSCDAVDLSRQPMPDLEVDSLHLLQLKARLGRSSCPFWCKTVAKLPRGRRINGCFHRTTAQQSGFSTEGDLS